jgi:NAD(P)-dependent dehydrogenase (short-subunit alcohol dehydrogenase family)
MNQLLTDKHAVLYGGGGSIGAGVAAAFAREGAHVHLAGRTRPPLEQVAARVQVAGLTVLDATDEEAVVGHLEDLPRIDVSFNLIKRGDVHGRPLTELAADDFMAPMTIGVRSNFLTARAAARRMATQPAGGVILWIGSGSSTGAAPGMGGTGPADAATDNLMRQLAREAGPDGVRVCGIWTAGVPETFADGHSPITPEQIDELIGRNSALRRAPRLREVAETAAFLASDRAGGMTATVANVTCGLVSER